MKLKSNKTIVSREFFDWWWVVVLVLGVTPHAGVWAKTWQKSDCVQLFAQKKYEDAGICFEKVGLSMGDPSRLPVVKRYEKGLLLRNAAISWHKVAQESIQVHLAAYAYERAVRMLQQYRREKLCETASRCRSALDLETQLVASIGYAALTVVVHDIRAKVQVRGHEYTLEKTGDVSVQVRPGSYLIQVWYPDTSKEPQRRLIQVVASTPMVQSFFAPGLKPRPISRLSIGLYSAGAITLAGGGVLLGVGGIGWVSAENQWFNPSVKMSSKDDLVQQRQVAQPLFWGGVGAIGAGALLMILGGVFHRPASLPQNAPQTPVKWVPVTSTRHHTFWVSGGDDHAF